jgi:hypothetical protein
MFNPFKQLTARALLALAFAGFSGAAFAGPGYDVTFDVAASGNIGTDFGVALADVGLTDYAAGTNGNLMTIGLLPGVPDSVTATAGLATAETAVPEPAGNALGVGGLLLHGTREKRR